MALVEPGAIQSQIWQRATMSATRTLGGSRAGIVGPMPALARMQDVMAGAAARAIPAEAVAQVVARALTVPSPRARYLVGRMRASERL